LSELCAVAAFQGYALARDAAKKYAAIRSIEGQERGSLELLGAPFVFVLERLGVLGEKSRRLLLAG
jgi:hypothetical protein